MGRKTYKIPGAEIRDLAKGHGGCIATDRITVAGLTVGYMYRETADHDVDSGWRFMAGDESQTFMDDPDNHGVYDVNTIANYDPDIIPLLDSPVGSAFARETRGAPLLPVDGPGDPGDGLHPDFPVVCDRVWLTDRWSVDVPLPMNRRVEEGSLILWRPGFTVYFTAWKNDHDETIDTRYSFWQKQMSTDARDLQDATDATSRRFAYRLTEDGTESLNGQVFGADGHLQVALYFDDEPDIQIARTLFASIRYE